MGESGSGKTTIADILEECYGLRQVKSYTTRQKRYPTEDTHTFISVEQFKKLHNLVAYTYFDGNYYGTTLDQISNNSVYVIDPDGVKYFKAHYAGSKRPIVVYLTVSMEERMKRMMKRGDSKENAAIRIKHDISAFREAEAMADYVIENTNLKDAIHEIIDIINHNN